MNRKIEQEINKTLECMSGGEEFEADSMFTARVIGKLQSLPSQQSARYTSRAFYPVIITLLLINLAVAATGYKMLGSRQTSQSEPASVLAGEYGLTVRDYNGL